MGRPRGFDVDQALASALGVFRRLGFEGASVSDLTGAMGITRPSLYAAFGNKETLFRKALDRYRATCLGFVDRALARPTAREVIGHLLYGYADAQTAVGHPPGCLGTSGALACSEAADPIRAELIRRRDLDVAALRERLARAVREGDLPAGTDPAELATFVMTVAFGMSVQAASGADRATLYGVVRRTLDGCPTGTPASYLSPGADRNGSGAPDPT